MLENGTRVAGYEIEGILGHGGAGVVYEAQQLALGRKVALKILTGTLGMDASFKERFRNEGRIQAAIDHPHIVTVFEAGEWEDSLFIAMRLVRGPNLKEMIIARELEGARTLRILRPIAEALDAAHEAGLIHRDIKPQNILVGARDRAYLADFGLTKGIDDAGLTQTGQFVGAIDYIAPEQIRGEPVTSASDIYGLSAVLYECLTGAVPFPKPSDAAVMYAHLSEPPPLVTEQRPELPPNLDDVVCKAMDKDPTARYATATALIDEAEKALGKRVRAVITPPGPIEGPEEAGIREREARLPTRAYAVAAEAAPAVEAPAEPEEIAAAAAPPPAPVPSPAPPTVASPAPVPSPAPPTVASPAPVDPPAPAAAPTQPYAVPARVGAPEAPEAPPEPIRRTPHIDLSPRPPLVPGQLFTALVFADTGAPRRGETAERIVLAAPPDVQELTLDVWLVTTSHFEIIDSPIKTLTIRRDEPRSETVAFRLAVKAAPKAGEEPLVSASFSYNGRPSGKVTLTVAAPDAGLPAPQEAPALVVDIEAVQPDLTVEISSLEHDGRSFEVRLDTPVMPLERRTETWRLPAESPRLVAETMARFFDDQRSANERLASLRGAGLEFFDAAPPLFKETYWRLIDGGHRLRNLYVVSDERSIPWELMIPTRRTAEGVERRSSPLGVELAVGRWHRQTQISPRQRVALKSSYVVAPRYEGGRQLAASDEEARFVCEHFNGERIQPARFDNLEAVLAEQGADLLHFACHGEADRGGAQVLLLEDTDTLDPQQIRAMRGLELACRKHKPLVFLNACELGRPVLGLVGASGFARSFIELDASGVIGTLWSVDDQTAHDVAIEFYQHLIDDPGTPFAEVLRKIRAKGFESNGMDTYAAYCFYGDPSAGVAPDR